MIGYIGVCYMKIGKYDFNLKNHTYIMGILNVTPDSFSDGGTHNDCEGALRHAEKMIKDGADIIDVGGESTRPGFAVVPANEEIERVVPIIEKIKSEFDIAISLDTYKPETALAGIEAGADLINYINNLREYPEMAKVIADKNVSCCLMHNRREMNYDNFSEDFFLDMTGILDTAIKAGIKEDKIILDPGIGFAKTTEQNLYVLNNLDMLNHLGCPWLLGTSRKSVIGNTLNLPVGERLEGTLATTAYGVLNNALLVRVHDVLENKRFITMMEAVRDAKL